MEEFIIVRMCVCVRTRVRVRPCGFVATKRNFPFLGGGGNGRKNGHNAECAAHLNRDHNATVNLQRRCERILADAGFELPLDDVERRLDSLSDWMHHSA